MATSSDNMFKVAGKALAMIKFEHSVFALPFAVASALYATRGDVIWGAFGWLLLAMVSARTAAMAFNRIADRKIDARNPRTADRHLASGVLPVGVAWVLVAISVCLFVLASGNLNKTCLILSPGVLVILLAYSFTKRFTWFSHFYLGVCLGLAPIGVWVGLTETVEEFPILLGSTIIFWVGGFDIIYSCLDADFDRNERLKSIPARFGIRTALVVALISHVITAALLVWVGLSWPMGWLYWALLAPVLIVLAWQHWLVRPGDLKRVNMVFFNINALFGIVLMVALVGDLLRQ